MVTGFPQFDGMSSGVKSQEIIAALLYQDTTRIKKMQEEVKAVQQTSSSYSSLDTFISNAAKKLQTISVSESPDEMTTYLQTFVSDYNAQLKQAGSNREMKSILRELKSSFNLTELGVSTNRDGSLAFDATKAKQFVSDSSNFETAKAFLLSGLTQLNSKRLSYTIDTKIQNLATRQNTLQSQIERKEYLLERKKNSLVERYSKMESFTSKAGSSILSLQG